MVGTLQLRCFFRLGATPKKRVHRAGCGAASSKMFYSISVEIKDL